MHTCSELLDIYETTSTDDDGNNYKVYEVKFTGEEAAPCKFEVVYGTDNMTYTDYYSFLVEAMLPAEE